MFDLLICDEVDEKKLSTHWQTEKIKRFQEVLPNAIEVDGVRTLDKIESALKNTGNMDLLVIKNFHILPKPYIPVMYRLCRDKIDVVLVSKVFILLDFFHMILRLENTVPQIADVKMPGFLSNGDISSAQDYIFFVEGSQAEKEFFSCKDWAAEKGGRYFVVWNSLAKGIMNNTCNPKTALGIFLRQIPLFN